MNAGQGDGSVFGTRDHLRLLPCNPTGESVFALLRDAVCVKALLEASDCRATGDDAQLLIAESIAVMAGNISHACMNSAVDNFPAAVRHAAGQLGALADSRYSVLQEAISGPDEKHSHLVDQAGWLDSIANEVAGRLVAGLQEMRHVGV